MVHYIIIDPNGVNDKRASLKYCFPKGMPTIEIQYKHPKIVAVNNTYPNQVQQEITGSTIRRNYILVERKETQGGNLKTLLSGWNTYDSY